MWTIHYVGLNTTTKRFINIAAISLDIVLFIAFLKKSILLLCLKKAQFSMSFESLSTLSWTDFMRSSITDEMSFKTRHAVVSFVKDSWLYFCFNRFFLLTIKWLCGTIILLVPEFCYCIVNIFIKKEKNEKSK